MQDGVSKYFRSQDPQVVSSKSSGRVHHKSLQKGSRRYCTKVWEGQLRRLQPQTMESQVSPKEGCIDLGKLNICQHLRRRPLDLLLCEPALNQHQCLSRFVIQRHTSIPINRNETQPAPTSNHTRLVLINSPPPQALHTKHIFPIPI